jgi:predicted secreted hydrolase
VTISFTANGETVTRVATGTGVGTDTTKPSIGITSSTSSASYTTGSAFLTLQGTASDNVGVTQVTWTNSRGGSGTATGTTSWSASGIALQSGSNVLTVIARDAAGNTAATTLTATYDNAVPTRVRGKLNKQPKR